MPQSGTIPTPDRPAAPGIYRPDCQTVIPQRQLPEAVCGFRRPGCADQPLTAVVRCHGQAKQEAHTLHHLRRVPSRQHLIFPLSAVTSAVRCCTAGGVTPFTVPRRSPSKCAPLSTMASFSGTCCTAVMAYVPSSFSRILTQRNRRWRSVGSFSPTRCILQRRQEPGSLSPSRRR